MTKIYIFKTNIKLISINDIINDSNLLRHKLLNLKIHKRSINLPRVSLNYYISFKYIKGPYNYLQFRFTLYNQIELTFPRKQNWDKNHRIYNRQNRERPSCSKPQQGSESRTYKLENTSVKEFSI